MNIYASKRTWYYFFDNFKSWDRIWIQQSDIWVKFYSIHQRFIFQWENTKSWFVINIAFYIQNDVKYPYVLYLHRIENFWYSSLVLTIDNCSSGFVFAFEEYYQWQLKPDYFFYCFYLSDIFSFVRKKLHCRLLFKNKQIAPLLMFNKK